jgi:nucleoside-diphosphate-sugar epimerase
LQDLKTAAESTVNIERLRDKTILITGASGTIGSFIVDTLLGCNMADKTNITVYALGRSAERLENRFKDVKTDKLIFVEYDMREKITFDFRADYIIHAGGNAYPGAFNGDPVGTIVENVLGTYSLLEYGRDHGAKRFLYVSSGEVYGQGDLSLDSFDESYGGYIDPVSPRSCYPISKRTAENLCASYSKEYGLETVIARPCHTYGPCITENDNRANVQFLRNALNGEDIVMKSEGKQMRSYCYVPDCVSAILTILINGKSGEAYNCSNPDARTTIVGLAEEFAGAVNRKVVFKDANEEDMSNRTPIAKQVLSSEKLVSLGWTGKYDVHTGVGHMIRIMKEI